MLNRRNRSKKMCFYPEYIGVVVFKSYYCLVNIFCVSVPVHCISAGTGFDIRFQFVRKDF